MRQHGCFEILIAAAFSDRQSQVFTQLALCTTNQCCNLQLLMRICCGTQCLKLLHQPFILHNAFQHTLVLWECWITCQRLRHCQGYAPRRRQKLLAQQFPQLESILRRLLCLHHVEAFSSHVASQNGKQLDAQCLFICAVI